MIPGGSFSCSNWVLSPGQSARRAMGTLVTNTQGKPWKRARAAAPLLYIHRLLLPTAGEGIPQPHQGLASATAATSTFICCLRQLYLGAQENKHSCTGRGRFSLSNLSDDRLRKGAGTRCDPGNCVRRLWSGRSAGGSVLCTVSAMQAEQKGLQAATPAQSCSTPPACTGARGLHPKAQHEFALSKAPPRQTQHRTHSRQAITEWIP